MAAQKTYRTRHLEIKEISPGDYTPPIAAVPLMLDRRTTRYWAEYAGQRYEGKDAEKVESFVLAAIKDAHEKVDWKAVIVVTWTAAGTTYSATNQGVGMMTFTYERKLYAVFPDRALRYCRYECLEETRLSAAQLWGVTVDTDDGVFTPPCRGIEGVGFNASKPTPSNVVYLPYEDALWESLCLLVDGTKALNEQLQALFLTPEGREKLRVAGAALTLAACDEATTILTEECVK